MVIPELLIAVRFNEETLHTFLNSGMNKTYVLICSLLVSLLVFSGLAPYVQAQTVQSDESTTLYREGLKLLHSGKSAEAISLLYALFEKDPAYSGNEGSVVFVLGNALVREGRTEEALNVWSRGLSAQYREGNLDPLAADAFVRTVFREDIYRKERQAAWAYLELLRLADKPLSKEAFRVVDKHVAQMEFLLPADLREEIRTVRRKKVTYHPGAGEKLVVWWRAQDPLIATPQNERLLEHLRRVAYAETHYATNRRRSGLDDRGVVYIRLGPPKFTYEVRMKDRGIEKSSMSPYRSGLDLNRNEFWSYRHIHPLLYYLFVEKDGYFQIALPSDLLPSSIRHATMTQDRWRATLEAWQIIYGQLALLHPDFAKQSVEIDDAVSGVPGRATSNNFVFMNRIRFKREDQLSAQRRDRVAPPVYSETDVRAAQMPVEARVARFLEPDGRTRVELFWGHHPASLVPDRDGEKLLEERGYGDTGLYLVGLHVLSRTQDYQLGDMVQQQYAVDGSNPNLVIQSASVHGVPPIFHIAAQWDVYVAEAEDGGKMRVGPRFKTGSFRADTLTVLKNDPTQLEMSDLVPVLAGVALDSLVRYPFKAITSETRLGLMFEVYHLTIGPDDRTSYTVEYEILPEGGEAAVSARTAYSSSERNTREYIELDLSDIREKGAIRIRVVVTDRLTGQQVSRDVDFSLLS